MEPQIIETMISLIFIITGIVGSFLSVALYGLFLQQQGFREARKSREYWGERFTMMGLQHREQMAAWRREALQDRERWERQHQAGMYKFDEYLREAREDRKETRRILNDIGILIRMIQERLDPGPGMGESRKV